MIPLGHILKNTYVVDRLVDNGSRSIVYQAHHVELGMPLALKVLQETIQTNPKQVGFFQNELRALARLRHPGVPTVMDLGLHEGYPYVLTEWLDGETLGSRLKRRGRLPVSEAVAICLQIGSVLVATHRQGIVHRELNPGNIFLHQPLEQPEVIKLLNFGMARVPLANGRRVTTADTLPGALEYLAPEQVRGDTESISAYTDQYALAMMAYTMLQGQPAFVVHDTSQAGLHRQLAAVESEPPPPPGEHVSGAVSAVILKALSKAPVDRFVDVGDFVHHLCEAHKTDGVTAPGVISSQTTQQVSGSISLATVMLFVGMMTGTCAGYFLRSASERTPVQSAPPPADLSAPLHDLTSAAGPIPAVGDFSAAAADGSIPINNWVPADSSVPSATDAAPAPLPQADMASTRPVLSSPGPTQEPLRTPPGAPQGLSAGRPTAAPSQPSGTAGSAKDGPKSPQGSPSTTKLEAKSTPSITAMDGPLTDAQKAILEATIQQNHLCKAGIHFSLVRDGNKINRWYELRSADIDKNQATNFVYTLQARWPKPIEYVSLPGRISVKCQ